MAVTIDYDEQSGSPTGEQWSKDGSFRATRMLRCDWAQRHVLARQLMGFTAGLFATPDTYPGVTSAYVEDASIAPFGDLVQSASGLNTYEKAILTVNYATPQAASGGGGGGSATVDDDGVIVEESLEPSVELLTIADTSIYWDAAKTMPVKDVEAPSLIVRMMDWTLAIRNVTSVPANMDDYIGYVNSEQIVSKSMTNRVFEAETLMFMGASQSRSWSADGPTGWNITFKFQYRRTGWNQFFRSGQVLPGSLYNSSGVVYKPFDTDDFVTRFSLRVG